MLVCRECGQENPEIARFCLACGASLGEPEPAAEERKLITVLFTDIVGSTARAEQMDPEDVRARLEPYYVRLRAELERFGGTVEKFIGDAVVALFGAPVAHEDDPERAVRAAFAVCAAIKELNEQDEWLDLKVRVGVNTGEALVVLGAKTSEGEGMAAGDVMNTAARLQSAAPVNGIVVGELTYKATHDAIEYREAEPISAKGKSAPVPVWEAIAVGEPTAGSLPVEGPLIGRDSELDALLELRKRVTADRRPRHATLLGAPGIGKSRLVAEVAMHASDAGAVHLGRCLPYGEGITYWPVTEILKSASGIRQDDAVPAMAEKLGSLLDGLETDDPDELRTMAAAISNLVGVPTTPRGTYSATAISQAELHWGIRRVLQLLARKRPLTLVIEDLHWAEPTLLELIRYLASDDGDAPIFILDSARPELAETAAAFLVEGERRRTISLEPLPEKAGEQLLAVLLGSEALARHPEAARLLQNAGGNPLFVEETVRMLTDGGLVDEAGWRTGDDGDALPVPTNLQSLLASRLDQLGLSEKQVAQHASVVGAVFWPGAVAHLQQRPGNGELSSHLSTLQRRDLVREQEPSSVAGEAEYRFKHILIRDVAYGQLPKGRRAELHVRFSDWVGVLPAADEEFVEIVAWHLEQACRLSREVARSPIEPPLIEATDALAGAARRAEQREGLREARRYYTRALEVLGDEHLDRQLELRLRRADIMIMLGELPGATEELVHLVEEAPRFVRRDVECEALMLLGDIDQRQGRAADAGRRLSEASELAEGVGDERLRVKVGFVYSALRADFHGEYDEAIADLRQALAIAEEIDDQTLRSEGHLRLSAILITEGRLEAAEAELRSCLAVARELGSHRLEAEATCWLGLVTYYRGDVELAKRLCRQANEWFERTGDTYFQVQNVAHHGLATFALADGRAEEAEEALREVLPIALQIGGWVMMETYRQLAEALVQQGRVQDARELVSFAARSLPEEDAYARACLLLAEASVATAGDEPTTAATAYAEALRVIEGLGMTLELGEARHALARSLLAFGDESGARTELERARAIFSRIGANTPRERIDRELAEYVEEPAETGPPTS
jgi:class 3 adenylate cyclase/tetratricopeptide (TPR) repeat protein